MAKYRKLGRTSDQRKALLRNQVTSLIYNGKIMTTEAKAKEIQKIVEGVAGGGVVKAKMTCANEIVGIEISPEVVDPEDVEMLQDLILAAINDAGAKASAISEEAMGKVTGGMKLPF